MGGGIVTSTRVAQARADFLTKTQMQDASYFEPEPGPEPGDETVWALVDFSDYLQSHMEATILPSLDLKVDGFTSYRNTEMTFFCNVPGGKCIEVFVKVDIGKHVRQGF